MRHPKNIFTLVAFLFFISCSSQPRLTAEQKQRQKMDEAIGQTSDYILRQYGFPSRSETVNGKLVQVFSSLKTSGLGVFAKQYYQHICFFYSASNTVEAWLIKNDELPVEQLNLRIIQPIGIK